MPEAMTALNGATSTEGIVQITEAALQGMITLRGDLASKTVRKAATGVVDVDIPEQGHANFVEDRGICWMSPDELLILCPYGSVATSLAKIQSMLGETHALCVDVSDARTVFELSGRHAREVLAKLCPVDLSPEAFSAGLFRRTRMAQVPAAFWIQAADTFRVVCFRSQASYVLDLLKVAAQPGSKVEFY